MGVDPTLHELLDSDGVPLSPKTRYQITGDVPAKIEVTSSRGYANCPQHHGADEGWYGLPEDVRLDGDCDPTAAHAVLTITPGETELEDFAFCQQSCVHTVVLPASRSESDRTRFSSAEAWSRSGLPRTVASKRSGV